MHLTFFDLEQKNRSTPLTSQKVNVYSTHGLGTHTSAVSDGVLRAYSVEEFVYQFSNVRQGIGLGGAGLRGTEKDLDNKTPRSGSCGSRGTTSQYLRETPGATARPGRRLRRRDVATEPVRGSSFSAVGLLLVDSSEVTSLVNGAYSVVPHARRAPRRHRRPRRLSPRQ